ncbi:MAG: hypothetical protein JWM86_771 [Thermoleophilia bacterium]|nr:hypothetical protein [Thermoleophilia bacterium]
MQAADPIRILAVAGSLREASLNRRLARLAGRLAPEGVELVEYERLAEVEPYDEDSEAGGFPPGATDFLAAIRAADGVFIATPEYNGSIPGQLKNALDWASRPEDGSGLLKDSALYGIPVAVTSASTGQFGAVWARDELVKVLKTQGARPLAEPSVTIPGGAAAFTDDGSLVNEDTTDRLRELLVSIADLVVTLRAARAAREAATA